MAILLEVIIYLGVVTRVLWIIRHVLQEMTVDTFVPNDTMIQNEGKGIVHLIVEILNYSWLSSGKWKIPSLHTEYNF